MEGDEVLNLFPVRGHVLLIRLFVDWGQWTPLNEIQ